MIDELTTFAEEKAQEAEKLVAFDGINLIGMKRKINIILGFIGRDGLFDEYTLHDISHIDAMLSSLEWLIPENTKEIMSPADWLMIVLAIYFHDMGMLVTKDEFLNRNSSGFPEFCEKQLFASDSGVDYKAMVDKLDPEESQRFLYQEFVRHTHAIRVREWIMGKASEKYGFSNKVMSETTDLLDSFDPQFRRDLGLICESHHLDDLNDFSKYKVSQPYGNTDEETTNLQYVAILLRTADLLHITHDRTPSLAFRLINPSDPLSQIEWAKQMAVKRVRSQIARNRDGVPDADAPRNTIEVHAYFTNPDGFFGLTSYLGFAESQLQKSFEWVQEASKTQGALYTFPWRYIDDHAIETHGFLKDSFRFTIDQAKILDLLTGHTLYNETSVVLRELVQNSLDAIRLRLHVGAKGGFSNEKGIVYIHWNSKQQVMTIIDNGTGMTQSIIEKHLLKVGASQYQDPDFKKQYPDFSSISRFGIGVLSTFMVADNVEIITNHPGEDQVRMLNLRSVHGKYLIQLLDQSDKRVPESIREHGTSVRLRVRPSATMDDVVKSAMRWIVIPGCDVTVTVDDEKPIQIGFDSPKDVLCAAFEVSQDYMLWDNRLGDDVKKDPRVKVRVEEMNIGNITIAFALKWWEYFDEWAFMNVQELPQSNQMSRTGICVGGIRVDFNSPGFQVQNGLLAIVNATGANSPKTNVARSGLERTPELEDLLYFIYTSYCTHVQNELSRIKDRKSFSLTWAAHEARWLLQTLFKSEPLSSQSLLRAVYQLPLILAENKSGRSAVSVQTLQDEDEFWIIEGQFFRTAERLIREVSSSASVEDIMNSLKIKGLALPTGIIICDYAVRQNPYNAAFEQKEVSKIRIDSQQRRLDIKWAKRKDPPRWIKLPEKFMQFLLRRGSHIDLFVANREVIVEGRQSETVVLYDGNYFVLPDSKLANYLIDLIKSTESRDEFYLRFAATALRKIYLQIRGHLQPRKTADEWRKEFYRKDDANSGTMAEMDYDTFGKIMAQDKLFNLFDPYRLSRDEEF